MKTPSCLVAVTGVLLCGCATEPVFREQTVTIRTGPEVHASCVLTNPKGRFRTVTPKPVDVLRSEAPLKIVCSKRGYRDGVAQVDSELHSIADENPDYDPEADLPTFPTNPVYAYPASIKIDMVRVDQN